MREEKRETPFPIDTATYVVYDAQAGRVLLIDL